MWSIQDLFPRKDLLTPIQVNIINFLKQNGDSSRDDICKAFGFDEFLYEYNQHYKDHIYTRSLKQYRKRTTIYDNLLKLQKREIVEKFKRSNGKRGRPIVLWRLSG